MNIYIGNFSYDVTGKDLREAFEAYGRVEKATVVRDKFSGDSRGFGFVEMPDNAEATAALEGIKGIKGKMVTINEARPQAKRDFKSSRRGGSGKFDSRRRNY